MHTVVFVIKISFHSYANETHFHMKSFALMSRAFIMRFKTTRKINGLFIYGCHASIIRNEVLFYMMQIKSASIGN